MEVFLRILELFGVTFLGAWAGGAAAFAAERKAREKKEESGRISAINRAIFKISLMYNALENVRAFSLRGDEFRTHPERGFKIDSPQPGLLEAIRFNFDELSFLLDDSHENIAPVLLELMTLEWAYTIFVRSIELRAEAMEEIHKAFRARPVPNLTFEVIQTVFRPELTKLTAATDQLIEAVDNGLAGTQEKYARLTVAAVRLYPGQQFLQINFQRSTPKAATA